MTIALDATAISERSTGAGRVLKNLLVTLPRTDATTRYVGLVTEEGARVVREAGSAADLVVVRPGRSVLWELAGAGREARRAGAGLLFTARELVGRGGPPTVMHVFEPPRYRLGAVTLRGLLSAPKSPAKDAFLHLTFGGSVRRAAAVTAGSKTTAAWLRRRYAVEPTVVYPGIDPVFLTDGDGGSREPYVLHPATGDRRENTELVLAAFARWRPSDVRLRLVGVPETFAASVRARADELGIADLVDVLGWVSDEELRHLYGHALVLVHPTRYEAFAGLPALEAMALGTPVVALAAPGSTEALEGVARLLERADPELLATELEVLVEDSALRERLGAAGRQAARRLTWEETARSLVSVFRSVL